MGVNKTIKKIARSDTDRQTHKHTDEHRDLETELAQWAESVREKKLLRDTKGASFKQTRVTWDVLQTALTI